MPDPISAINFIVDKVNKLREINEKIKNAEVTTIISELQLAVSDIKLDLADERDKNAQLQNQIRELNEQLELICTVEFKNNFVYRTVEDQLEGPYCPRCYGKVRKLIKLLGMNDAYGCHICQFILQKNGQGVHGNRRNHLTNSYLS